jgi:ketosteroid isomerase-like protein
VLASAASLVAAFAASDAHRYFACFAPAASFVFHNVSEWLPNRASYERLWKEWEDQGFRVEQCHSLEPRVTLAGADTAVFTHRVRTRLAGLADELVERETIVFQRSSDGGWLAVHEHLSLDPHHYSPQVRGPVPRVSEDPQRRPHTKDRAREAGEAPMGEAQQ